MFSGVEKGSRSKGWRLSSDEAGEGLRLRSFSRPQLAHSAMMFIIVKSADDEPPTPLLAPTLTLLAPGPPAASSVLSAVIEANVVDSRASMRASTLCIAASTAPLMRSTKASSSSLLEGQLIATARRGPVWSGVVRCGPVCPGGAARCGMVWRGVSRCDPVCPSVSQCAPVSR